MSLPTGLEFSSLLKKRLRPHALRVIATIVSLMPQAHKFTNGQNLTVLTSHDVDSDNDSIFKAAVTQGVLKALRTEYHLHCSRRP